MSGTLDVDPDGNPAKAALDAACRQAVAQWEVLSSSDGPVLWVVPSWKLQPD